VSDVCISRKQRNLHVASETAAVVLVAPLLGWIAATGKVTQQARVALGTVAVATVLIDGGLLRTFRRSR
jgi:hypothetical protein